MKLFEGAYTALITPFYKGKLDTESLEKIIDNQLKGGIAGFIVNGTTAESPTLTQVERMMLLELVKQKAKGKAKVIFGSGSNNTETTIAASRAAEEAGVDGLLVVVPYYNKPPQQGLYEHFAKVASAVSVPIMLYNVPGRTVTSLSVETIRRLSQIKNIVAIKEATGKMDFGQQVIDAVPKDFIVSSGDDETCLDLKALGGRGVVSVCSHILPRYMSKWMNSISAASDKEEFLKIKPIISDLYITSNPIPVKYAMHILGLTKSDEVRLPLCTLDDEQKKYMQKQIEKYREFLL